MGITEIIFSITKAASKLIPSCRRKLNDKLLSACKVNTPLIIASSVYCTHRPSDDSSFDLVNFLLRSGRIYANVNAKNNDEFTILMRAEKYGYAETVRILREHGAR